VTSKTNCSQNKYKSKK